MDSPEREEIARVNVSQLPRRACGHWFIWEENTQPPEAAAD